MDLKKLIILNGCEKPCAKLVCRVYSKTSIKYVNLKLRKHYGNMKKGTEWASLKDFGFVKIRKIKGNTIIEDYYVLKNPSKAKYKDGTTRQWQGKTEFSFNDIMNMGCFD